MKKIFYFMIFACVAVSTSAQEYLNEQLLNQAGPGVSFTLVPDDRYGSDVAVSGEWAVIGAQNGNNGTGTAYVLNNLGGEWQVVQELLPADLGNADLFGVSVAIDGDDIAVAARGHNGSRGAVYTYHLDGSIWVQGSKLVSNNPGVNYIFGSSLAIDGNLMVVGERRYSGSRGAILLFELSSPGTWEYRARAQATSSNTELGTDVDISGNSIVAGAFRSGVPGNLNYTSYAGKAVVYEYDPSTATLSPGLELYPTVRSAQDRFGTSVAIENDLIVVGAFLEDHGLNETSGYVLDAGSAYSFKRAPGTTDWQLEQKIIAPSESRTSGANFGSAVAIDNGVVAIGARADDSDFEFNNLLNNTGAVFIYRQNEEGDYEFAQKVTAQNRIETSVYGNKIAMDGNHLLVGSTYGETGDNTGSGMAYAYSLGDNTPPIPRCASNLFISEYIEGSGLNKMLEIFNPTASPIELASYEVRVYTNGSVTPQTVPLSGTIPSLGTMVILNPGAAISEVEGAFITAGLNFNGNDVLELYDNLLDTPIDRIGEVGVLPDGNWLISEGQGIVAQDESLVRSSMEFQGSIDSDWQLGELEEFWFAYGMDFFDNLGSHEYDFGGTQSQTSYDSLTVCPGGTLELYGTTYENVETGFTLQNQVSTHENGCPNEFEVTTVFVEECLADPITWEDRSISCSAPRVGIIINSSEDFPEFVIGMEMSIAYDASVFRLYEDNPIANRNLPDDAFLVATETAPGNVHISVYLNEPSPGDGIAAATDLFHPVFEIIGEIEDGTTYDFAMSNLVLSTHTTFEQHNIPPTLVMTGTSDHFIRTYNELNNTEPIGYGSYDPTNAIPTTVFGLDEECEIINEQEINQWGALLVANPSQSVTKLKLVRDVYGDQTVLDKATCTDVSRVINASDRRLIDDILSGAIEPTPLQLLAADVNLNGGVTSADAAYVTSRTIKKNGCEFPQVGNYDPDGTPKAGNDYEPSFDWRFIPEFELTNVGPNVLEIPLYDGCLPAPQLCQEDFTAYYGVLLGDVNLNWKPANTESGLKTDDIADYKLMMDFVNVDTAENGHFLVPVIVDSYEFTYGVDMVIDLDGLGLLVEELVPVEGISTKWNHLTSEILLQSYEYGGLSDGTTLFYLSVSDLPEDMNQDKLNANVTCYVNGTPANARMISHAINDYSIELYPNPVQEQLRINYSFYLSGEVSANIFDITGNLVLTNLSSTKGTLWTTLDVSSLKAGSYIVQVISSMGTSSQTFIKH